MRPLWIFKDIFLRLPHIMEELNNKEQLYLLSIFPVVKEDDDARRNKYADFSILKIKGQFITLDRCGVPNHPIEAAQTGDTYCLTILHHLTTVESSRIVYHLNSFRGSLAPTTTTDQWLLLLLHESLETRVILYLAILAMIFRLCMAVRHVNEAYHCRPTGPLPAYTNNIITPTAGLSTVCVL